ncbi:MAG: hypothetical protein ACE5K1_01635 [Acidiferrobacterales bacterium]
MGAHIFGQPVAVLESWLGGTVITRLLPLATDHHADLAIFRDPNPVQDSGLFEFLEDYTERHREYLQEADRLADRRTA